MTDLERENIRKFDKGLIRNSKEHKMPITAIEVGFLIGLLDDYIKNENNKDKGIHIAEYIKNNRIDKIREKICNG